MGLLTCGTPLTWKETKAKADYVRQCGIKQFIRMYHALKTRRGDTLMWGDEIEYMIVKFDHDKKTAKLSLRAHEILTALHESLDVNGESQDSVWKPEYASYMIEGTPRLPYGSLMAHFNIVESDMTSRRKQISKFLHPDEVLFTMTCFPRIGCPNFTSPSYQPTPNLGASRSLFYPDEAIYQGHPRFKTLTENIRKRRQEKVVINVPVFMDSKTQDPFIEDFSDIGDNGEALQYSQPNHVYMDAMGFGMGCSSIQVTFQASCIEEARKLYDQLAPICPIMMALSANSPVYRGVLCDTDCRWNVISASVDCRTREERGLKPLVNEQFRIYKSRFSSIDSYLEVASEKYNDIPLVYDPHIYNELRAAEIDHLLAQHIAHLFIRDPVVLFQEHMDQSDEDTDHFEVDENMQNAQKRDAVNKEQFWFRKNFTNPIASSKNHEMLLQTDGDNTEEFVRMNIDEIINGKNTDIDADTHCTIQLYLSLIQNRASGNLMTPAAWTRQFITLHPHYKKDSLVSELINYDFMVAVHEIQRGIRLCPELLGTRTETKTSSSIPDVISHLNVNR